MLQTLRHYSSKPYPKNLFLKRPVMGASVISLFNYVFLMIYRPVHTHPGYEMSYEFTMAIYCLGGGLAAFAAILIVNRSGLIGSLGQEWTILKEVTAIIVVVFAMGLATFLLAFLVEAPGERWNVATILHSIRLAYMIGGIPLYLFTIININSLFTSTLTTSDLQADEQDGEPEEWIAIDTPLKKDQPGFYPHEFLYAEADGNYVHVYLQKGETIRKEVVRISISSLEEQLADFSFIIRTHRAFIVNLKKVKEASGNALGFRITLSGIQQEIPVSRRHAGAFRKLYSAERSP